MIKNKIIVGIMMVCMLTLAGCRQSGTSADSATAGNAEGQQTTEAVDNADGLAGKTKRNLSEVLIKNV